MMYIFHILINSADTDEMPLFGSSLFAKVPVYYYCLPVPRQLKFTKVIQACVYYCILHMFIGSNLVGSQPGTPPFSGREGYFLAFTWLHNNR